METIVKGKIVKIFYSNTDLGLYESLFCPIRHNKDDIQEAIDEWRKFIGTYNPNRHMVVGGWKEIFRSKDIDFRLNVDEYFDINEKSCKIEKIEGSEGNQITYYIDYIAEKNDNKEIEEEVKKEAINKINRQISYLQDQLNEIRMKECIENYKENKKWYQFWR